MQAPSIPDDEAQRLAALQGMNLLFTPPEERFDRVTRLASTVLGTPVALVTLVANEIQWFKSAEGLDIKETPRDVSICGHAILGEDTFVVADTTKDPRFADNPMVTGAPFIKAYAGHPLHAANGSRVGTLCVVDHKPRKFTRKHLQILRGLAAIAESELERMQLGETHRGLLQERDEQKRNDAIDELTQLWNQVAVMKLLHAELARAGRGYPTCVAIAQTDYSGNNNVVLDRALSDAVLVKLAERIRHALREFDIIGYSGEGEFIIVISNCEIDLAKTVCERIRSFIEFEHVATPAGLIRATVSIGLALCTAELNTPLRVVAAADAALSRAKALGGNRVEVNGAPSDGDSQRIKNPDISGQSRTSGLDLPGAMNE